MSITAVAYAISTVLMTAGVAIYNESLGLGCIAGGVMAGIFSFFTLLDSIE